LKIPRDHARREFADHVAKPFDTVFPDPALDAESLDRLERIFQRTIGFIPLAGRPDRIGKLRAEARVFGKRLQKWPRAVVVP